MPDPDFHSGYGACWLQIRNCWVRALSTLIASAILLAASTNANALVFAINEGVTYRVPSEEVRSRYAVIAADLSKLLKQPVTVEPIPDYQILRASLQSKAYDIAMVHPAHISILAIKRSGYRLVAITKGFQAYTAAFLVPGDATLRSLGDLRGGTLGVPDEDSITAWMVRASLREAKIDGGQIKITYTRYQDAVPFFVQNKLTMAGATAASGLVKDWESRGGRVLARSRPVPIKHVIAGPSLSVEQIERVREYLLALSTTEEGRKKLEPTKYQGFENFEEGRLLEIGEWLGL